MESLDTSALTVIVVIMIIAIFVVVIYCIVQCSNTAALASVRYGVASTHSDGLSLVERIQSNFVRKETIDNRRV